MKKRMLVATLLASLWVGFTPLHEDTVALAEEESGWQLQTLPLKRASFMFMRPAWKGNKLELLVTINVDEEYTYTPWVDFLEDVRIEQEDDMIVYEVEIADWHIMGGEGESDTPIKPDTKFKADASVITILTLKNVQKDLPLHIRVEPEAMTPRFILAYDDLEFDLSKAE